MVADVTLQIILIMWLIDNWYSLNIDAETAFSYAILEEELFMKIIEVIADVFEEHYTYEDISTLINSVYGLGQEKCFLFKECIKTTTINEGFK